MKTKETKKNKGITLITLVNTIIVILILASVSIVMLTGNNGILIQANKAKNDSDIAAVKEKVKVEALGSIDKKGDFNKDTFTTKVRKNIKGSIISEKGNQLIVTIDGYDVIVDEITGDVTRVVKSNVDNQLVIAKPGVIVSKTEKDNYSDGTNTATVPAGFTVSKIVGEQDISEGLVIYDIPESDIDNVDWTTKNEDGAYNVQTLYNQFVWIPVASAEEYQRDISYPSFYCTNNVWAFAETTPKYSTFTDTEYLPKEMQPTTDEAISNENSERNAVIKYNGFYIARYESGKDESKVVSKQNTNVYDNESQRDFKSIGRTMYGDGNNNVKSAMCSGIQWDMVMKFIDGKRDAKGNLYNVKEYKPDRHTESAEKTGKNLEDKVQNIYDLEGNYYEYVAEKNSDNNNPCVIHGCSYRKDSMYRASRRLADGGSPKNNTTFRTTLYILK